MDTDLFEVIVTRASLSPSIHNAQPTRWRLVKNDIWVAVDPSVTLPYADPTGAGIALSCGAAVEATLLALSRVGYRATVQDIWANKDQRSWTGHRMAAIISFRAGGSVDGLSAMLETRFTWRGTFDAEPQDLCDWARVDTALVSDESTHAWLARLNDVASLPILRQTSFRKELFKWFRLKPDHPRASYDGMNLAALRITLFRSIKLRLLLGPLWPLLDTFGWTGSLTAEAKVSQSASVIACFHRPMDESLITSGRAYLRLLLEAASLGLAGWPMAALTYDIEIERKVLDRMLISADRRLVQVIRIGKPMGSQPIRARRLLKELIA